MPVPGFFDCKASSRTTAHTCASKPPVTFRHFDNGSLTGLTSAMYLDAAGQPATCTDPGAGLHIKDRAGEGGRAVAASHALPSSPLLTCLPAC